MRCCWQSRCLRSPAGRSRSPSRDNARPPCPHERYSNSGLPTRSERWHSCHRCQSMTTETKETTSLSSAASLRFARGAGPCAEAAARIMSKAEPSSAPGYLLRVGVGAVVAEARDDSALWERAPSPALRIRRRSKSSPRRTECRGTQPTGKGRDWRALRGQRPRRIGQARRREGWDAALRDLSGRIARRRRIRQSRTRGARRADALPFVLSRLGARAAFNQDVSWTCVIPKPCDDPRRVANAACEL